MVVGTPVVCHGAVTGINDDGTIELDLTILSEASGATGVLGTAHVQRLLRESPSTELRNCLSNDPVVQPDATDRAVAELLAQYDMLAVAVCDATGQLLGAATNKAFSSGNVTLSSQDGSVNIPVPIKANSTVNFFQDGKELGFIASVPAAPGETLEITVTDLDGESKTVYVPVLDGAWPEYADVVPTNG